VSISSLAVKKAVLRNSFRLCSKSDSDWIKQEFITPNLTPKEQMESCKLENVWLRCARFYSPDAGFLLRVRLKFA